MIQQISFWILIALLIGSSLAVQGCATNTPGLDCTVNGVSKDNKDGLVAAIDQGYSWRLTQADGRNKSATLIDANGADQAEVHCAASALRASSLL